MQRIFVGDVQGCADELDELVERAHGEFGGEFELWLVGDLINRGPANLRVLDRVRELREAGRARVVLGNHEIGLFMKWFGQRGRSSADTIDEILSSPRRADWFEWLRALPLAETGEIAGEPFAMVHASVHPGWGLATLEARAQHSSERLVDGDLSDLEHFLGGETDDTDELQVRDDLDRLTRCRAVLDDAGSWTDALPDTPEDAWHARFALREHGYGVVYGHWALQGLHVAPGFRGLDTGCVHNGRDHEGFLTAWLPDDGAGFATPDTRLWHVAARATYYRG